LLLGLLLVPGRAQHGLPSVAENRRPDPAPGRGPGTGRRPHSIVENFGYNRRSQEDRMRSADSPRTKSSRRQFLRQTAAATAAPGAAKGRVLGANDRINVGFIGCGMQFLGLLQRGFEQEY